METDTIDLLDQICENARFGKKMLAALIKESEDGSFRNALAEHFARYHSVLNEAKELLHADNAACAKRKKPMEGIGKFAHMALSMNLLIDKTSSHMAEMVMQGSLSNITDLASGMRTFAGADQEATALGRKFVEQEQENIGRMIDYL